MDADPLDFDAVILAGGRSARLGGVPKQDLTYDGDSLLRRSVAAAGGARAVVVVGPGQVDLPAGTLSCREDPPFSGPAAAIAAGLAQLHADGTPPPRFTLVLACDMPNVGPAVRALKAAVRSGMGRQGGVRVPEVAGEESGTNPPDGVVAVSADGRRQPLVGLYSTAGLLRSAGDLAAKEGLINASVRALLASLDVQPVAVPAGSTADVDTWDDAAALGVTGRDPLIGFQGNAAANYLGGKA